MEQQIKNKDITELIKQHIKISHKGWIL